MEDEDGVEGGEFFSRDTEVEADHDAVEDDAKFEDEEGGDLLAKGPLRGAGAVGGEVRVLEVELRVVYGRRGCLVVLVGRVEVLVSSVVVVAVRASRDRALEVVAMRMRGPEPLLNVPLSSKIQQEGEHDGGHGDGRHPAEVGPVARHAYAGRGAYGVVGRVEQVDEGGGDDDAGAEVAGEEVDVEGGLEAADAGGEDGEDGGGGGGDEDDEDGRDAGTQAAVVIVALGVEVADDVAGIGGREVDASGVEAGDFLCARHGCWALSGEGLLWCPGLRWNGKKDFLTVEDWNTNSDR